MLCNAINWFEIPVFDFERAEKFYNEIFNFTLIREEIQDYKMGIFPVEGVNGSIVMGDGYVPTDHGAVLYLNGGDDLNEVLNRVDKAGGKVATAKFKVTDEIGYAAFFYDTEGNKVGLHSKN